jgi:uncharacterized lipoprotein YddW (UPF0748 family)
MPVRRSPARPALRRLGAAAIVACIAALPTRPAGAQSPLAASAAVPAVAREFRGAWVASVANIDWPSRPGLSTWEQQAELVAILDRAAALRLNAVILQVRPAADALYDSPHEPWSEYLTGVQGKAPEPYYDPLRFAVEAAHARGLELHAWFNPYRARHPSGRSAPARTHVSVTHPALVRSYGRNLWMDPGEPAVVERTLRVMLDVVRRYDVDGIHLDDYFYPYPETAPGATDSTTVSFPDSASYARYVQGGGTLARDDWRRQNVDRLVEAIYRRTKALKPWVKVGISPFGIWRPGHPAQIAGFDAYAKLYADARRWLRTGWVDYLTPQLYWPVAQTAQSFPVLLRWWLGENVRGRHVWPGYNTNRAAGGTWADDELLEQIRVTRAEGATGGVHFSMRALMPLDEAARRRDSVLVGVATPPPPPERAAALTERLRARAYTEPALVPSSPWLVPAGRPAAPGATLAADTATGEWAVRIGPRGPRPAAWWTVRVLTGSASGGAWRTWVIPGAQRRLVVAPPGAAAPERVLVTAVDRTGAESPAAEVRGPER